MNTLQKSPFIKDILLSVGGWTFSIWKEGVKVNSDVEVDLCFPIFIKVNGFLTNVFVVTVSSSLVLYFNRIHMTVD